MAVGFAAAGVLALLVAWFARTVREQERAHRLELDALGHQIALLRDDLEHEADIRRAVTAIEQLDT